MDQSLAASLSREEMAPAFSSLENGIVPHAKRVQVSLSHQVAATGPGTDGSLVLTHELGAYYITVDQSLAASLSRE